MKTKPNKNIKNKKKTLKNIIINYVNLFIFKKWLKMKKFTWSGFLIYRNIFKNKPNKRCKSMVQTLNGCLYKRNTNNRKNKKLYRYIYIYNF